MAFQEEVGLDYRGNQECVHQVNLVLPDPRDHRGLSDLPLHSHLLVPRVGVRQASLLQVTLRGPQEAAVQEALPCPTSCVLKDQIME